jgi:predicted DNA-binding WGR domain protein
MSRVALSPSRSTVSGPRLVLEWELHFVDGGSRKYHRAILSGTEVTVMFGRINGVEKRVVKTFDTVDGAAREYFVLSRDKMRKGYAVHAVTVAGTVDDARRRYFGVAKTGVVVRERAEVDAKTGAAMVLNLMSPTPDEDVLFDSMFTCGDSELVARFAAAHPAVAGSDLTAVASWLVSA